MDITEDITVEDNTGFKSFHAFGFGLKNSSPNPKSHRLPPMFSSRSFTVFHVTFKSMIHFELIFVKGVSSESKFIFWYMDIQLSQCHLWKRLSLLHRIAFAPLSKSFDPCCKSTLLLFSFLKGSQISPAFNDSLFRIRTPSFQERT